jgi:hypothetical protein
MDGESAGALYRRLAPEAKNNRVYQDPQPHSRIKAGPMR